jgi:hypothetical protein
MKSVSRERYLKYKALRLLSETSEVLDLKTGFMQWHDACTFIRTVEKSMAQFNEFKAKALKQKVL